MIQRKTFAEIDNLFKQLIKDMCCTMENTDHETEETKSLDTAMSQIVDEYYSACKQHPHWPTDIVHQTAIMMEEAGESIREALRIEYKEGACLDDLKKEVIQTGAMCLRLLINLPK